MSIGCFVAVLPLIDHHAYIRHRLSTSTLTGTRTLTITSSIPVQTLYSLSLSTSIEQDDEETTSLSPVRRPLTRSSTLPASPSSSDDVVVVTQFTTITPTQATTSTSLPTLSSSSSSTSARSAVFPGGSSSVSSNGNNNTPASDDAAAASRSSSSSSLSTGAIAGEQILNSVLFVSLSRAGLCSPLLGACRWSSGIHQSSIRRRKAKQSKAQHSHKHRHDGRLLILLLNSLTDLFILLCSCLDVQTGIAVGAVAAAILLGILGFLFCCRRRKNRHDSMYATTGDGRSDEKLAPTTLFNPDFSQTQTTRTRSSGANSSHHLLMANVGGSGTSSFGPSTSSTAAAAAIGAGAAGIGAGRSGNRFSSGGQERQVAYGKNKPVPDVPPPVSSLQYMRPAPGQRGLSDQSANSYSDPSTRNMGYYAPQPQHQTHHPAQYGAIAAAGMAGRPSTASPNLATQTSRNATGKRVSAPLTSSNASTPVQTAQEKSDALKRSKSVAASLKSIPSENLGKGAGYASPMPPIDPLGKPIDQKTWRERNSRIHSGEGPWSPDTMLTPEQKLRRDSQLMKLQALQAGTSSSKPNLSKLREQDEPIETSPLLNGADNSFDSQPYSPEKISAIPPTQAQTLRNLKPASKRPESGGTILPYADDGRNTAPAPPRSPPPNPIYPSLPPNSPTRNAGLSQSVSPSKQPRYELHQPLAKSQNPIRASFITAPQFQAGGPPPAPSSSSPFTNRLPMIPGSRPASMMNSTNTPQQPEYRRSSTNSFGVINNNKNAQTPYAAATTSSPQGTPFFQHQNGSNGSFGTNRSSQQQQQQPSSSLADNIYGGLTKGLSDRDLLRLSQPLQPQGKK